MLISADDFSLENFSALRNTNRHLQTSLTAMNFAICITQNESLKIQQLSKEGHIKYEDYFADTQQLMYISKLHKYSYDSKKRIYLFTKYFARTQFPRRENNQTYILARTKTYYWQQQIYIIFRRKCNKISTRLRVSCTNHSFIDVSVTNSSTWVPLPTAFHSMNYAKLGRPFLQPFTFIDINQTLVYKGLSLTVKAQT
jgi:hypothetical protein